MPDADRHIVVNRVRLKSPIDDEAFAGAQRDLQRVAAEIEGLQAFYLASAENGDLLAVIVADSEEAIDQMREVIGNSWMRDNVIPHAAAPPDRTVCKTAVAFERSHPAA